MSRKNPSATKAGPGRFHKQGHEKDSPLKNKGAPPGFLHRLSDDSRKTRREHIASMGRRQYLKFAKALRRGDISAEGAA